MTFWTNAFGPWRARVAVFVLAATAWLGASAPVLGAEAPRAVVAEAERETTLVIGRISKSARKHSKNVLALGNYLVERISDFGYKRAAAVVTEDLSAMVEHLRSGAVDLISETPYGALELRSRGGGELLLHEWKQGAPYYHSVFFARRESGIETLQDLRGKLVVFEVAESTSAYFLPITALHRAGLKTVQISSVHGARRSDAVNIMFAGGETNQAVMVIRSVADAGAFSNLDWRLITRENEDVGKVLRIFHESDPVVRSLLIARKGLGPALQEKITSILLALKPDQDGANLLEKYNELDRFTRIDAKARANLETVSSLKRMLDLGKP